MEDDAIFEAASRARVADTFLTNLGFAQFGNQLDDTLDRIFRVLQASDLLDQSGSVLISSEATLVENDIYFLGLNPGGADDPDSGISSFPTLRESLALSRMGCCGFDQDWSRKGARFLPGQSPMQTNFKAICKRLGRCYAELPAANVVFTRSSDLASHGKYQSDLDRGIKVHRILLDRIRPKLLWLMGNPANAGDHLIIRDDQSEWRKSGYSNWTIGRGRVEFCGQDFAFAHTPHLTFWSPKEREPLIDWAFEGFLPEARG